MAETTDFGFEQVSPAEKTQRVRGVFESVAARYDVMNDLMSVGMHRLWKRFAVELAGVRPGCRVLDIAGGTADMTRLFSDKAGPSWRSMADGHDGAMLRSGAGPDARRKRARGTGRAVRRRTPAVSFRLLRRDLHRLWPAQRHPQGECAGRNAARAQAWGPGRGPGIFAHRGAAQAGVYDWYSFNVLPRMGKLVAGDEASYRYLADRSGCIPTRKRCEL